MARPELNSQISLPDFQEFYWLKEELRQFCKSVGLEMHGSKIDLTNRIIAFLETGEISSAPRSPRQKTSSKFDWNKAALSLETVITDNYKNSESVRSFFTNRIGAHFHFTVGFIRWMKANAGKTLKEAAAEWTRLHELKKDRNYKTEIAPQFEYNRYMRDFLADNPDKSSKDAMKYWKLKRAIRGTNEYAKADLELK